MYTTTGTCENSSFFERGALSGSGFFFKKSADYPPYGTLLHHRHGVQTGSDSYRYAFQGQEKDDEVKGEGNSYNYTYRMHDPRIGRFFAVDPLESKYAFYSPYQFSGNELISKVELEGLEPKSIGDENLRILTKATSDISIADMFIYRWNQAMGTDYSTLKYVSAGSIQASYDFFKGVWNFATSDAWKGETWSGVAKTITSLTLYVNSPTLSLSVDAAYGTNFTQTRLSISCRTYNFFASMPNWTAYDWGYNVTTLGLTVAPIPAFGKFSAVKSLPIVKKVYDATKLVYSDFHQAMVWTYYEGRELGYWTYSSQRGMEISLNIADYLSGMGLGGEIFAKALEDTGANMFTATWVKGEQYAAG